MARKRCSKCDKRRDTKFFRKRSRASDGLQSWCKDCSREHHRAYYRKNKAKFFEHSKNHRKRIAARVNQVKEANPCADCGRHFPACAMDYDHRDPATKEFDVGQAVCHGFAWERIEAEIAKCDLVCACCHRVRTHMKGAA